MPHFHPFSIHSNTSRIANAWRVFNNQLLYVSRRYSNRSNMAHHRIGVFLPNLRIWSTLWRLTSLSPTLKVTKRSSKLQIRKGELVLEAQIANEGCKNSELEKEINGFWAAKASIQSFMFDTLIHSIFVGVATPLSCVWFTGIWLGLNCLIGAGHSNYLTPCSESMRKWKRWCRMPRTYRHLETTSASIPD